MWNGPMGVFEFDKFAKGTMVSTWVHAQALTAQTHNAQPFGMRHVILTT